MRASPAPAASNPSPTTARSSAVNERPTAISIRSFEMSTFSWRARSGNTGARKQIQVVARVRDREAAARTGCEMNVDRARRRLDRKLLDPFPAEQPRQRDAPNDASVAEALHAVRRSAQDDRARSFGVPHRIDDVASHRERER